MILLDCTLSLQDTSPFACWRAAGYGDTLKNMSHGDFCLWYLSFELSMLSILPIKNSELSKVLNEVSWSISTSDLHRHFKLTHLKKKSGIFHHSDLLYNFTSFYCNYFYILLQPFGISRSTSGLEETGLVPPPRRTRSGDDYMITLPEGNPYSNPIFRCYVASSIILCVDTCSSQCNDMYIYIYNI